MIFLFLGFNNSIFFSLYFRGYFCFFVPMSVSWPFGPDGGRGRGLGLVFCCGDWELFTIVSIWFKRVRQAIGSIAYIFMANLLLLTYKLYAATTATTTIIWIPSSSSSSAPIKNLFGIRLTFCLSIRWLGRLSIDDDDGSSCRERGPQCEFYEAWVLLSAVSSRRLDLDLWFVLPCCMSAISGLLLVFLEVNNIQLILWLVLFVKT